MRHFNSLISVAAILTGVLVCGSGLVHAADAVSGHHHHADSTAETLTLKAGFAPKLELLMPKDGEYVENPVAILFEADGDLETLTMSAAKVGTHLHIGIDETSLRPVREQILSVGGNRYAFVLDLPLDPGSHVLSVYWAGADHRTIISSIRMVSVNVRKY